VRTRFARRRIPVVALAAAVLVLPALPADPVSAQPAPEAAVSVVQVIDGYGESGTFAFPESVHVAPSGHVYVADTGHNVIVHLDATGTLVDLIGGSGADPGEVNHPYQVAVDDAGNVYVADGFNYRVQKFDAAGDFVASVSVGANKIPTGIAVAGGEVFVANTTDNRIQVYDDSLSGGVLRNIGTFGTGNGQLQGPRNIDVAGGRLYVADQFNDRISVFNATTGAFVRKIGSEGTTAGRFESPLGVTADAAGNVIVADTFNSRVQRFLPNGRYAESWNVFSGGLDFDAAGRVYVVATTANLVRLYQPGDGVLVDARIRVANLALRGNDIYDPQAGNSQIGVATVPPGSTVRYTLTFQNDSAAPDRIRVRTTPPARHFTVRYLRGAQNVTAAVHAGTLQSPVLAPQGVFTLTAQVTVRGTAPRGSANIRLITATSVNRAAVRDAVKMSTVRRT
jgi:sugar lactone lactonase YvrE